MAESEPLIDTAQSGCNTDDQTTPSSGVLYEAIEQIHLDKNKLPPELRDAFDLQEIKDILPQCNSFSAVVCGKTGTGKSALVNGIIGQCIAEEGDKVSREGTTTGVFLYSRMVDGVAVKVWDSPGLSDGTAPKVQERYISEMFENCRDVDLMMYCIKMYEKRVPRGKTDNPDVNAMARITEAFGPDIWKKTIIVLTFANCVEAHNVRWKRLNAAAKEEAFQREVEDWTKVIRDILISDLHVPKEIADNVVVTPAGHYADRELPDRDYWLSTLWFQCLAAMTTTEGQVSLVRINAMRIKRREQVKVDDFDKPAEEQPILVDGAQYSKYSKKALLLIAGYIGLNSTAIAAAGGAGAAIGASAGLIGAGIGAAIGAPIGFIAGLIVISIIYKVRKHKLEKVAKKAAEDAKSKRQLMQ